MQAISILIEEHKNIERLLKILSKSADKIENNKTINPEVFIKGGSFITQYMDQKHHSKEELLFDLLATDYGLDKNREPLSAFLIEHDQTRSNTRSLRHAAFSYSDKNCETKNNLLRQVKAFIELLNHHIKNENDNLYPLAAKKLSQDANEKLTLQFIEIDNNFEEKRLLKKLNYLESLE